MSRSDVFLTHIATVQGIAYLVEKGMLQYDARTVATFLLENCDKLDKTQVGGPHERCL